MGLCWWNFCLCSHFRVRTLDPSTQVQLLALPMVSSTFRSISFFKIKNELFLTCPVSTVACVYDLIPLLCENSAIVTLLNNLRLKEGKPTLGFLNPWIYQTASKNPTAFFDVTQGNNQYACCPGFYTAPGYDPVTGVGTPNYEVLRSLLP